MFETKLSREKLYSILETLRAGLENQLGEQFAGLYLYGSQARGDARPDSDIDVLIVLDGDFHYDQMLNVTSDLAWRLSLDNDILITRVFVSKEQFQRADSPFMANVQREAVAV